MPSPRAIFRKRYTHAVCSALAVLASSWPLSATSSDDAANQVDAVTRLAGFVRWPDAEQLGLSFRLCLRDDDPAVGAFITRRGNKVSGKPLTIHALAPDEFGSRPCHLAYFSDGLANPVLIGRLRNQPTLTVSPQTGFANRGGLVEMSNNAGRLTLIIDRATAANHPLHVSAQLLAISHPAGE